MVHSPLSIESTRGQVVENRHDVSLVVVDAAGAVIRRHGDIDVPVPARSSLKPLQALALLRSGAAGAFDVADEEVALACASHNGEPRHVEFVAGWLNRLGLDEDALGCAPALPRLREDDGIPPATSRIAHNCSGKHTGFLTVAAHLGVAPGSYLDFDAPVQQAVLGAIADACRFELTPALVARDGCSAPAACLPLAALAGGLARTFLDSPDDAASRILFCMGAFPWLVGGTDRFDTNVAALSAGQVLTKAGADGMHVAVDRRNGITMAAKCHDGSRLPVELTLVHALVDVGGLSEEQAEELVDRVVVDDGGMPVGEFRPT